MNALHHRGGTGAEGARVRTPCDETEVLPVFVPVASILTPEARARVWRLDGINWQAWHDEVMGRIFPDGGTAGAGCAQRGAA